MIKNIARDHVSQVRHYHMLFRSSVIAFTLVVLLIVILGGSQVDNDVLASGAPRVSSRGMQALNAAPNAPSNPTPADGATIVPPSQVLTWAGGDPDGDTVTYTVAFSTSTPPSAVLTTTDAIYTPTAMTRGTRYYWQITASDGVSQSVGGIWSFTTTVSNNYLPLVVSNYPPPRMAVFEAFLEDTESNSTAAGSVIRDLAQEYKNSNVVFLEYDIDNYLLYDRVDRWIAGGGDIYGSLPLVMIDSGHQISNGYEDFDTKYRAMVDTSLARDPQAEVVASGQRSSGNLLVFDVRVVNRSDVDLADYAGTVWAIVYEEFASAPGSNRLTKRFVRAVASTDMWGKYNNFPPGATGTFRLGTEEPLSGVNWDNLRAVVLVDYCPFGTDGACDMLQAVSIPIQ